MSKVIQESSPLCHKCQKILAIAPTRCRRSLAFILLLYELHFKFINIKLVPLVLVSQQLDSLNQQHERYGQLLAGYLKLLLVIIKKFGLNLVR